MWSAVSIKTPPAALPLTLDQMKARLRIDAADEDATISAMMQAARATIDGPQGIGVAMVTQTWTLAIDRFAAAIALPGAPVADVAEVRYMDTAGAWQTLAASDYRLVKSQEPARLYPAAGKAWPAVYSGPAVVEIDYVLGTAAEDVDAGLVAAFSLLVGHFYENREAVTVGGAPAELPLGVEYLLARHRRGLVAG